VTGEDPAQQHGIQIHCRMQGKEEFWPGDDDDEDDDDARAKGEADSDTSLTTSAFESQHGLESLLHEDGHADPEKIVGPLLVGNQDDPSTPRRRMTRRAPDEDDDERSTRSQARREAYRAARLCLRKNDSGDWDELGSRAIGRRDHCEEEIEL